MEINIFFIQDSEMEAAIKLEESVADNSIFLVIVSKFSYRQKFCSVTLFIIDNNLKIGFYYAVISFGLTVGLRVKCGRKFLLNIRK